MSDSRVIVVIAGGTASGKSTISAALAEQTDALTVCHDRYYRDIGEPRGHNYDHPDALDTDLLVANLADLAAGRPTQLPRYDFRTHARLPDSEWVEPRPVVLVEGILVLADPRVAQLASLSVYVDAPDDLRLIRRIRRDVVSRGRDLDEVLVQYLATVRPMHEQFVMPCKARADLVLDGLAPIELSVAAIRAALARLGVA